MSQARRVEYVDAFDEIEYDGDEGGDCYCYCCQGDGYVDAHEDDPINYYPGEMEPYSSCGGSGRAKDMTIW